MKPSERIEEIYNSKTRIFTGDNDTRIQTEDWIESILDYLDEQYEQQKPTTVKCGECGDEFEIENEGEDTCENCA